MDVHIICCNDSIEYAVVNDKNKALKMLDVLKTKHFKILKTLDRDLEHYLNTYFWHIHTIKGE